MPYTFKFFYFLTFLLDKIANISQKILFSHAENLHFKSLIVITISMAVFGGTKPGEHCCGIFYSGSRSKRSRIQIRLKNLSIFNPKKLSELLRNNLGGSSRILIRIYFPSRIPDPGVKKARYHGSWSATLPESVVLNFVTNGNFLSLLFYEINPKLYCRYIIYIWPKLFWTSYQVTMHVGSTPYGTYSLQLLVFVEDSRHFVL